MRSNSLRSPAMLAASIWEFLASNSLSTAGHAWSAICVTTWAAVSLVISADNSLAASRRAARLASPGGAAGGAVPCASAWTAPSTRAPLSATAKTTDAKGFMTVLPAGVSGICANVARPPRAIYARGGLRPRVSVAVDLEQALGVDRGVDLGRRQRGVAQQLLDGAEIAAARQQVGGEGMPQRVRRGRLGESEGA